MLAGVVRRHACDLNGLTLPERRDDFRNQLRACSSLADPVTTLKELSELGVGFVSITEALDMTTTTGRAMAGLLAVFVQFEHDLLRERVRSGLAEAKLKGKLAGVMWDISVKRHSAASAGQRSGAGLPGTQTLYTAVQQ